MAEMINLHFLSLLEALLEVHSSVLSKLLPIWTPILFAHHIQVNAQNRYSCLKVLLPTRQWSVTKSEKVLRKSERINAVHGGMYLSSG